MVFLVIVIVVLAIVLIVQYFNENSSGNHVVNVVTENCMPASILTFRIDKIYTKRLSWWKWNTVQRVPYVITKTEHDENRRGYESNRRNQDVHVDGQRRE